jgi:hypothetical protein
MGICLWLTLGRCQYLDYVASNGRMIDEYVKDLKGSFRSLVEALSRNSPGRVKQRNVKLSL